MDEVVTCYTTVHHARCSTSPTTSSAARSYRRADVVRYDDDDPTWWWRPTRAPPRSPTSPTRSRVEYGFWLGGRLRLRRLGRLRPQEDGDHRPRRVESVKRLFRELGTDTQSTDFTVVGVGDMSGDVFGNGMLLAGTSGWSAAFDHRHIFLDPDPDAGHVVRRAAAAVRPAPLLLGRLRRRADLGRGRGVPAYRQVDPDLRTSNA